MLDAFIKAMLAIAKEAGENPDLVKGAPHTTATGRCDEVLAARKPTLCYHPMDDASSGPDCR